MATLTDLPLRCYTGYGFFMLQAWTPLYLNHLTARPNVMVTGYLSAIAWLVRACDTSDASPSCPGLGGRGGGCGRGF